ncbi:MAG: glycine zipper 2TM domain-containing protein [Nitrincola lacisaponensis]|uniref:Outer membrane lipoprotein n=1 Tax=Nitrincola lacisaponensis TaxID=267850 RepID=A0A063XZY6_9GAMM|nr:glycine zipper 2TM domain-containing protein [Nitrincola lacisaponensis]KDE39009.1 Outer membrane lipoprotein [Nitrincola lacisaponensis]
MNKKTAIALTLLLSGAVLTGCAQSTLTGTSYSRGEARQAQSVQMGRVESLVPVVIEGRTDGIVGAGTGAVIGGVAGHQVGGGTGRQLATVLGAVAGGVAGQRVEEMTSRRQGVEITVRLDNGSLVSVVQEVDQNQVFSPGDRVRVLGQGSTMRVTY